MGFTEVEEARNKLISPMVDVRYMWHTLDHLGRFYFQRLGQNPGERRT